MASTQMQRRTTSTPSPFGLFPLLARDMDLLQENMRRLLQGNQGQSSAVASALPQSLNWVPPVEIRENEDELTISAELAGVDADAVAITIDDDVLTISGVKADERRDSNDESQYYLVERSYGEFRRSFTLPSTVDPDTVEADFDNGVLNIHLKKRDAARQRGRQIPINASGSGSSRAVGSGSAGRSSTGSQRTSAGASTGSGAGGASLGSTGGGMMASSSGEGGSSSTSGGSSGSSSGEGMSASGAGGSSGSTSSSGRSASGSGGTSKGSKSSSGSDSGMSATSGGSSGSSSGGSSGSSGRGSSGSSGGSSGSSSGGRS
jgi:HSP20 family molecular chaperone IbpA